MIKTTSTFSQKGALADAPEPNQLGFQDPATPAMEGVIDLHHDICFFLTIILVFVVWMLFRTVFHFHIRTNPVPEKIIHGALVELAWTLAPSLILVAIAVPSFSLLYGLDELAAPGLTVKAIGHQWYWSYEYSGCFADSELSVCFDSYMLPDDLLASGQLRLLEVDNRVVLAAHTHVRLMITAADVLHSWAVPSLGIKCDAVPGRLNQTSTFLKREGVFYGQCSELCGANHAFMPIVVEAVNPKKYVDWLTSQATD